MLRRLTRIAQPDEHVGRFDQPLGALDADRFHLVLGLAQAGRVGQHGSEHRQATTGLRYDRASFLERR